MEIELRSIVSALANLPDSKVAWGVVSEGTSLPFITLQLMSDFANYDFGRKSPK